MFKSSSRHLPVLVAAALLAAPTVAQEARNGGITITNAWSRATSPRAQVGAGFVDIRNRGNRPDRLLSGSSPRAERVEVHTMSMDGGVMRMRPLPGGVVVPAGGTLQLAPGGNHLMLVGLKQPLKQGETVPVTLRFERAGPVQFRLAVGGAGAMGAGMAMGHGQ